MASAVGWWPAFVSVGDVEAFRVSKPNARSADRDQKPDQARRFDERALGIAAARQPNGANRRRGVSCQRARPSPCDDDCIVDTVTQRAAALIAKNVIDGSVALHAVKDLAQIVGIQKSFAARIAGERGE